jgi:hypothetical protein
MNDKMNNKSKSAHNLAYTGALAALVAGVLHLGLADAPVAGQQPSASSAYPAPSFPVMKTPRNKADIMPFAKAAARNESGFLGLGFGAVRKGEKALLITSTTDDAGEMYIEAIMDAMRERGAVPIRMPEYELVGVTRQQAKELRAALVRIQGPADSSKGWSEGCMLFEGKMDWFKANRPDLHELCQPKNLVQQLPEHLRAAFEKMRTRGRAIPDILNKYMDEHPDIRGVFYGRGGPVRFAFKPQERWLGVFRFDNLYNATADGGGNGEFPADVLMLSEEMTMEPGTATQRVTVTDAAGTDVRWEMTEEQAQRWVKGHYRRGHLFLFPTQAFGAYAQSTVNFPALDPEWIPLEPTVKMNGKVVSHSSHAGFFPRMTLVWKDGYLSEVQGGGNYGELLRTAMKIPGINDTKYPLRDNPGYFWHWETAYGTNPKGLRPNVLTEAVSPERERDGIIHWGLGIQHFHDEGVMHMTSPPSLREFGQKTGLPSRHGIHQHTYFNTVKYFIRGADRSITVVDRGRSTSLDSPEVRALASRYGDPNVILAADFVPAIPGVNAPGSFEDYGKDPWAYEKAQQERVLRGEVKHQPDMRFPRK